MNISFFDPLNKAWGRMVQALFKPFDIKKWFVVGFSAFLADLLDTGTGGGGYKYPGKHNSFNGINDLAELPEYVLNWLSENPIWAVLIAVGILILIVLLVVFTWISSRGKFIFLDNVVFNRALITVPWKSFARLGNSLFLWRLAFGIISFLVFSIFTVAAIVILGIGEGFDLNIPAIVLFVLILLFLIAVILFIGMLLNNFIVPVMYKNNILTMAAWNEFLKIFRPHFFSFILYALLLFVLYIAAAIVIIAAGFAMCCIGFILLIIPYISTVITLPISYTFRAYSLEFLSQFGDQYSVFSDENLNVQQTE